MGGMGIALNVGKSILEGALYSKYGNPKSKNLSRTFPHQRIIKSKVAKI